MTILKCAIHIFLGFSTVSSFKSAVLDLGGSLGVVLVSYGIPKNLRILDLLVDIAEESDKTFETDLTRMSPAF